MVGYSEVMARIGSAEITSGLPVTRPRSAAALQNCHFRNGAAGSDASQNGLRSSDEHGSGPNGVDWRVLTVWDSPHREQRLATTWEQLRGEVMQTVVFG
jgi:hypothetical protein